MNSIFLNETPALRIALFFILGISVGYLSELEISNTILLLSLILIGSVWVFSMWIQKELLRIKIQSILSFVLITSLGFVVVNIHLNHQNKIIETYTSTSDYKVLAQVISAPVEKENSYKVDLKTIRIQSEDTTLYIPHKTIVYFAKDSLSKSLTPGRYILINNRLNPFQKPINPGNIDFSKIYRNKNILSSTYIPQGKWQLTNFERNSFQTFLFQWRMRIKKVLDENLIHSNSNSILSALLLGQQSSMDRETKTILADAGIVHILAVSGLHVGIVYLLLSYLTFFIKDKKYRFIKLGLVLTGIWLFVFITGVPPSAFRAGVMFSFFAFGKNMSFHTNSFNIIASSALFMLMINPLLLFDVGFQLSYSAVLGIITFQQPIYNSFYVGKIKILDKTWSLASVSVAATLGTLIFVLYYFNQFPTYFIFTNLIAIPVAFILLLSGIALLVFHSIPIISDLLIFGIDLCINSLIGITEKVPLLPMHVIRHLYPELIQIILLGIGLLLLGILAKSKEKNIQLIIGLLLIISIYFGYSLAVQYHHIHQREMAVFQMRKGRAIAVTNGLKSTFFIQNEKDKYVDYELAGFIRKNRIREVEKIHINTRHNFSIKTENVEVSSSAKSDTIEIKKDSQLFKIADGKNKYTVDQLAWLIKW